MKRALICLSIALAASAGEKKPLPGQAGNDDVELVASVIVDRDEIKQALGGSDLGAGYVAVRIKVMPKADDPIRVSPDDFTLLSRKDGERSPSLSAYQIAGRGALVVKRATASQTVGTDRIGPSWGGISGGGIGRMPGSGGSAGTGGGVESGTADAKIETEKGAKDNPLLAVLQAKSLPDKDTKEPVEGLLYFNLELKVKPKDLSLQYKGAAGRLTMDFK
jgi:hypothetical protein